MAWHSMYIVRSFLLLAAFTLVARNVGAQPSRVTWWTVEAKIAGAENVVVATIATVSVKVLDRSPGPRPSQQARPRSRTLTTDPLVVNNRLLGLMSRWMSPRARGRAEAPAPPDGCNRTLA